MLRENRHRLEIMRDVCSAIISGNKIFTHIIMASRLTFVQSKEYLKILSDNKLIIISKNDAGQTIYEITDKGLEFNTMVTNALDMVKE